MGEPGVPERRGGRGVVAREQAGMPAMPVIMPGEQLPGVPYPLVDGISPTLGWEYRPPAKGGPALSARAGSPAHARTIAWSPWFGRILLCLIALGAASFIAMIILPAVWADPTSSQNTAEQNVDYTFFAILGCFIGVVAGKFA